MTHALSWKIQCLVEKKFHYILTRKLSTEHCKFYSLFEGVSIHAQWSLLSLWKVSFEPKLWWDLIKITIWCDKSHFWITLTIHNFQTVQTRCICKCMIRFQFLKKSWLKTRLNSIFSLQQSNSLNNSRCQIFVCKFNLQYS